MKILTNKKLVILILTLLSVNLFAKVDLDQITISLNQKNTKIKKVLSVITEKSGVIFFYNSRSLDNTKKISLSYTNEKLSKIIKDFANKNNLTYEVIDNEITFHKKTNKKRDITGVVKDANGETLPGANVFVKGTTTGSISDVDGKFSLKASPDQTIVFSSIGYTSIEMKVGDRTEINVSLNEDIVGLDEVVVVGYGYVKKSDLTGAISSIKSDDLSQTGTSSVMHMLSGKVSGMQVKQNSAQPGGGVSVLIRGASSTGAGNTPLYVIDGFPVSSSSVEPGGGYDIGSRNPLNTINPNDIESIEVLKDASATAIYGARAANGVILITTKSAKEGKFEVEYDYKYGVQTPKNNFDLLSGQELMEVWNHAHREKERYNKKYYPYGDNGKLEDSGYSDLFSADEIANAKNYDYEDMVTRNGAIQEHNIVMKSGTERTKVYSSFNYYDQKGMLSNLDFKRYTGRINLDQKIFPNVTVGTRMTASMIENSNSAMGGLNDASGMISSAFQFPTFIKPKNDNGEYNLNIYRPNIPNPLSFNEVDDKTYTYKMFANTYAEVDIFDWLKAKVKYGFDYNKGKRKIYLPNSFLYGANSRGKATINTVERTNELFEVTTSFNKSWDKFNLNGVAGLSQEKELYESFGGDNNDFLTDIYKYNNIGAGQADRPGIWSNYTETNYQSYFSRINLNWASKYLLTFTFRADGSDKFGENNKWGYFPSGSIGWTISQEDFMKAIPTISHLKARFSYGQTGNANIGGNAFAYYQTGGNYGFGNKIVKGVKQTSLANQDLKWETTTEANLGIELGLFKNRIHATMELYKKNVEDLLSERTLAPYLPINKVYANIGSTQSSGWELTLTTQNITGEFNWSTNFTLSHYEDKWESRNPEVILKVYEQNDASLHAIYGYLSDGILQVGEEYPENSKIIPGEIKVKDINGVDDEGNLTGSPDGKIDDADKVYLGSKQPKYNFGINNTFSYKGFDLSIYLYGMLDRDVFDSNLRELGTLEDVNNTTPLTYKAWSSENQDGTLPSGIKSTYSGSSDFYRTNVDFIRVKNITLGYTVNKEYLKFTKYLTHARVYLDFNNLGYITNYDGGDPETDSWAAYPFPFTFTVGASIKF
jgi:TonB-linked SusC/RagA family outer membrane protein